MTTITICHISSDNFHYKCNVWSRDTIANIRLPAADEYDTKDMSAFSILVLDTNPDTDKSTTPFSAMGSRTPSPTSPWASPVMTAPRVTELPARNRTITKHWTKDP